MKDIVVFYSDFLLKVNAPTIKYFEAIDFAHEIDWTSPQNKVQLIDGVLNAFLIKKFAGKEWETLEVRGLSRQEVIERRNKSIERRTIKEEEKAKQAKETVQKMEKVSIDQQMQVEKHQRKHIKNAKKSELSKAQDEIFGDLDEVNKLDQKLTEEGSKTALNREVRKNQILNNIEDQEKKAQ